MAKIIVNTTEVSVLNLNGEDYICLTDMMKAKDGEFFVTDWLRNRNTLEYIGIWEKIYNPNFNYGEFAIIRNQAGLNRFKISVKDFVQRTNAIGIMSKAGRYGGTYAHKDIAFEFGMWISPKFKLLLIKEFERLKRKEAYQEKIEWNASRVLSKANYRIHTDAIKNSIIPNLVTDFQKKLIYPTEADLLNVALFGMTAKEWKEKNPNLKGNQRDYADIRQLLVLCNIENLNAIMINDNIPQSIRIEKLNKVAIQQLEILENNKNLEELKTNSIKQIDTKQK